MKNHILPLIISSLFISCSQSSKEAAVPDPRCQLPAEAPFHAGSGSLSDPYLICSTTQWNTIDAHCIANSKCDGKHFLLGNSLSFSDLNTTTDNLSALTDADSNFTMIKAFEGNFNGGNHMIKGAILIGTHPMPVGLFSALSSKPAYFRNIKMSHSYINSDAPFVGSILGHGGGATATLFENISISKNVLVGVQSVGGIVADCGNANGNAVFKNISSDIKGTVNPPLNNQTWIGSAIGFCNSLDTKIEGAVARGDLSGAGYAGGLVGHLNGTFSLKNIESTATINGLQYVGGLLGMNTGTGSFENIKVDATISAQTKVGGIVGISVNTLSIKNAEVKSTLTATTEIAGGVVGENNGPLTLVGIETESTITTPKLGGGLVGSNQSSLTSTDAKIKYNGTVSGENNGGVFGRSYGSGIIMTDTEVEATMVSGNYSGGFAGEVYPSLKVTNLSMTADIKMKGDAGYAGFSGRLYGELELTNVNYHTTITQQPSAPAKVSKIAGFAGGILSLDPAVLSGGTYKTDISLLGGQIIEEVGGFVGRNVAPVSFSNVTLETQLTTAGPVTCTDVDILAGNDVNSTINPAGLTQASDFSGLSCIP